MNMNKYFLVPVTAAAVKYKDTGLRNVLSVVDPELGEKENERIEFMYGKVFPEHTKELYEVLLKDLNTKLDAMFKMRNIPNKLVVVENGNSIYELGTESPLTVDNKTFLEVFAVSGEQVVDFFVENENYSEQAANFFQSFDKKKTVVKK